MSSRVPPPPNILRFVTHDPGSIGPGAKDAAHIVGSDDNPMRGDVVFVDGAGTVEIRATPIGEDVVALSLPVRAGRAGHLMLQTCIAPTREEPYSLYVELARHRIKHFIQKCEEWQMWDPGLARGAMRMWEEARGHFAQALLAQDAIASERHAQRSLEVGIEASEHLAMSHAEILLHRRYGAKAASSTTLGVVVRPGTPRTPALEEAILRDFDVLHLRADWREIEPKRGKPDFTQLDRWMQWAAEKKKPVMLGPLLDLREEALPDHARVFRHDYESFRDLAYDHIDRVAARYATNVGIWNVGSGFHANEFLELSVDQMIDLSRRAVVQVRQRNRKANTLMELVDCFGEGSVAAGMMRSERSERSDRPRRRGERILPWRFAELLQQEGIALSAIGLRLTPGRAGSVARDLFQLSCLLDRFLGRESRLMLTSFGVPSIPLDSKCGFWREGWSGKTQASWSGRAVYIGLSKPFVEALFWAEATDGAPDAKGFGLFDEQGQPQPVLAKLSGIRKRLRKPLGPRVLHEDGPADNSTIEHNPVSEQKDGADIAAIREGDE